MGNWYDIEDEKPKSYGQDKTKYAQNRRLWLKSRTHAVLAGTGSKIKRAKAYFTPLLLKKQFIRLFRQNGPVCANHPSVHYFPE